MSRLSSVTELLIKSSRSVTLTFGHFTTKLKANKGSHKQRLLLLSMTKFARQFSAGVSVWGSLIRMILLVAQVQWAAPLWSYVLQICFSS